jgi:hypothetical protein
MIDMTYRLEEIEVPPEDPYINDELDRRKVVDFLTELIGNTGSPFVLAIDGPWGTGKSTLIRMLQAVLESKDYKCVDFNAWQVDYVTDPLVAMVSCLVQLTLEDSVSSVSFIDGVVAIRRLTSLLAKRSLLSAVKALTPGGIELENEIKIAKSELRTDPLEDIVDAFLSETRLLSTFREELENAAKGLAEAQGGKPLIFFIDELDRCRPTFAIELLERIKHLLNVKNMVFVLSVDKSQLEASIAAVYGGEVDASEYLRRFIDVEFGIPTPNNDKFVRSLVSRFKLDEIFDSHLVNTQYDKANFIETFSKLATMFDLSLRAQERCMTRFRIVLDQIQPNQYMDPIIASFLIVLRLKRKDLFFQLNRGEFSPDDAMALLATLPGGKAFVDDNLGVVLEALLVLTDVIPERREAKLEEYRESVSSQSSSNSPRSRASLFTSIYGGIASGRLNRTSLQYFTAKIDMAANIEG